MKPGRLEGYGGRGEDGGSFPWPENVDEIPAEAVAHEQFDCVLFQSHKNYSSAQELGIARLTGSHLIMVCQQAFAQALSPGMPADRLALIPNGVDLRTFRPVAADGALRKKHRIPQSAPLVGFVGRLSWEKTPTSFCSWPNTSISGRGRLIMDEISHLIRYLAGSKRPTDKPRSAAIATQPGRMDLAEIPARKERR